MKKEGFLRPLRLMHARSAQADASARIPSLLTILPLQRRWHRGRLQPLSKNVAFVLHWNRHRRLKQ